MHPPCPNEAAYMYKVRLGWVLGRFDGPPLQVMGIDPLLADGVDPGCLDAPEWLPAGGMEGVDGLGDGARQQIAVKRCRVSSWYEKGKLVEVYL